MSAFTLSYSHETFPVSDYEPSSSDRVSVQACLAGLVRQAMACLVCHAVHAVVLPCLSSKPWSCLALREFCQGLVILSKPNSVKAGNFD